MVGEGGLCDLARAPAARGWQAGLPARPGGPAPCCAGGLTAPPPPPTGPHPASPAMPSTSRARIASAGTTTETSASVRARRGGAAAGRPASLPQRRRARPRRAACSSPAAGPPLLPAHPRRSRLTRPAPGIPPRPTPAVKADRDYTRDEFSAVFGIEFWIIFEINQDWVGFASLKRGVEGCVEPAQRAGRTWADAEGGGARGRRRAREPRAAPLGPTARRPRGTPTTRRRCSQDTG